MQKDVVVNGNEIGLWDKNDLIISHDALDWLKVSVKSWEVVWRTLPNGKEQELIFRFQLETDAILQEVR